jgi:hypothetical protein
MTMHSIMIQEMARNVQADRQRAAERRRPVSAEPEIYPAIDSVVVSHSWGETVRSTLARFRLVQLQWPIRLSEG